MLTSHAEVSKNYCIGQFIFSWATFTLLIAGAFKLVNIYDALPELLIILIIQYTYFRYRFKKLFESKTLNFRTSLPCTIFTDILSKVFFHIILFIILTSFSGTLVAKAKANNLEVEWRCCSFFESSFVVDDCSRITSYFFVLRMIVKIKPKRSKKPETA